MITIFENIEIINEGLSYIGSLLIDNDRIIKILSSNESGYDQKLATIRQNAGRIIDGEGKILIPGVIDDQVHFREPGATEKGDIFSESRAAVLGGVTSYMDMPNNNPPACSLESLERKYAIARKNSFANYSFYLGANNSNIDEIKKVDSTNICGVKVFMGSSTGNMLVDKEDALNTIFKESPSLIATHCEDEKIIRENLKAAKEKWGEDNPDIPFSEHPVIRSREACIESSKRAIDLAITNNSRLHILHISTAEEIDMLCAAKKISDKITGEVCVHYLWFDQDDYPKYGSKIKCNPSIKNRRDRDAIREGVKLGKIDALATDHAPHLFKEKMGNYFNSPSGLPLIQHSLQMMMQLSIEGILSKEQVVRMMCHSPADCFKIEKRGYLREGYYADLVVLSRNKYRVTKGNIAYKCGWSPLEETTFDLSINDTFVNGVQVVKNGRLTELKGSSRLIFNPTTND